MEETTLWQGSPSQSQNLGVFVLCGLLCWLIVPIFIALKKYLDTRCLRYALTSQRLRIERGILSKQSDDLELYRVKDLTLVKPFGQRLFGTGTVVLLTSDHTTPEVRLTAIKEPDAVRDLVRNAVEAERDRKRVTEVDMT